MSLITKDQLKKVCPSLKDDRSTLIANLINEICPKYGINTKDILHEFLATIAHESGEFTIKVENMNYTTPQRLVDIWPSRFSLTGGNGKLKASDYVRNAEKLANEVYANRMGNGNPASGDGFRYRGAGFSQITGFDSYSKYAKYIKKGTAEAAELVRTTDEYALDSACWLFAIEKGLLDEADKDDFLTVTRRINGGVIGLADRVKYYERAKQFVV